MKRKLIINSIFIGVITTLVFLAISGIVTALIPNPLFTRMIEKSMLDYFFLITSSVLIGIYVGVVKYKKHMSKKCEIATYSGGIGSFFAFACPVCNKLLVVLLGGTFIMTYLEPYRPILGFLSIGILGVALFLVLRR